MLTKLLYAGASLLVAAKRELAATADAGANGEEFIDFDMQHSNDEGYKFHYANYGNEW